MSFSAGAIRCCGFDFAPQGWLLCDGQTLPVGDYPELFAAVGDAFGGDGVKTFCVHDLQAGAPVHAGQDAEGMQYTRGQIGGLASVTLQLDQLPSRTGFLQLYATPGQQAATPVPMMPSSAAGEGQAHNNMAPFLALNACICLNGLYPART